MAKDHICLHRFLVSQICDKWWIFTMHFCWRLTGGQGQFKSNLQYMCGWQSISHHDHHWITKGRFNSLTIWSGAFLTSPIGLRAHFKTPWMVLSSTLRCFLTVGGDDSVCVQWELSWHHICLELIIREATLMRSNLVSLKCPWEMAAGHGTICNNLRVWCFLLGSLHLKSWINLTIWGIYGGLGSG